jgi:hypothetical protein
MDPSYQLIRERGYGPQVRKEKKDMFIHTRPFIPPFNQTPKRISLFPITGREEMMAPTFSPDERGEVHHRYYQNHKQAKYITR